jgi:hypothetical protein
VIDYKGRHDKARADAILGLRQHMEKLYREAGLEVRDSDVVGWKDIIEHVIDAAVFRSVALVAELSPRTAPPLQLPPGDLSWIDMVVDRRSDGEGWMAASTPEWIPPVFSTMSTRAQNALRRFIVPDPHWERGQRPRTFRSLLRTPHRKFLQRYMVGPLTLEEIVGAFRSVGIEWDPGGGFVALAQREKSHDVSAEPSVADA